MFQPRWETGSGVICGDDKPFSLATDTADDTGSQSAVPVDPAKEAEIPIWYVWNEAGKCVRGCEMVKFLNLNVELRAHASICIYGVHVVY